MKNTFAILGSGMQGTAAAYDLAKFADPDQIYVGDASYQQAIKCASRVNGLVGREVCTPMHVDALDPKSLNAFLSQTDIVLSCLPYWMHPMVAKSAIETITDMVDLGGNTDITMQTLELDDRARDAGITVVPDCGLAPGLVNNIGCALIETLDKTETVRLYCGVLPQNPKPPFNYKLTFNMEGLVTEYDYEAVVLRKGEVIKVDTLSELETLHIDELGEMEAFTTSGGTSTAPFTFEGTVQNYEYKTIRFPGHCALMRIFKDFGFWREDEVTVKDAKVRPKDVFNTVFGPELAKFVDKDLCAVRGVGIGLKDGRPARMQIDLFDRQDEATGFTSMERLTGFSMSIVAQEVAASRVGNGCVRYEKAMSGTAFLAELARRGITVRMQQTVELEALR
ncbi:MAG: saccharopine dehydrogenase NADP-binding domain-containing protein [Fimbriimonadaceae bacterium]|nr:saccharopine dehydrogenase NADP-binding domain-containing protein [Fimbriimonadaceae bacterium]